MDRVDRKMKHILLVLREPFLDRIPSLKTLVWFLLNHNHRITYYIRVKQIYFVIF